MSKDERIENPKVREYIYDFFPKKTNSNPLFVKVLEKVFQEDKLEKNCLRFILMSQWDQNVI